jgi:hypothetical protein
MFFLKSRKILARWPVGPLARWPVGPLARWPVGSGYRTVRALDSLRPS